MQKKKKKMENKDSNRYLYANVYRSIIHNSNNVETTQMSSDRKMNKQNVVYTNNEILLILKEEWSHDTYYNMDETCKDYANWN